MKKIIVAFLFVLMVVSMTACGNGGGNNNPPTGDNNTPSVPAGDDTPTTPTDDTPTIVYDFSGVKYNGLEAEYDGSSHPISAYNLPEGFTAEYKNNNWAEPGYHTVIVEFYDETHKLCGTVEVEINIRATYDVTLPPIIPSNN